MKFESPPVIESYSRDHKSPSFRFEGYQGSIVAHVPSEIVPALNDLETSLAEGLHAAGFISYEAAPGFDPTLAASQSGFPVLCFGLFSERRTCCPDEIVADGSYAVSPWRPSIEEAEYACAVQRIHEYIAAGDTYQVNYTFKMWADFKGDSRAFYRDLCRSQRAAFCAYLDLGQYQICSVSPELFFKLSDGRLTVRPMKGTKPRGRWLSEDLKFADELCSSPKDKAENLMIVDLLRNDMGKVSVTGSVSVEQLWQLERYETVFQLTSTVSSQIASGTSWGELFQALFPCGSITGAPKVRTMEIIAKLESRPRGLYTGAIGFLAPDGDAQFSVAIRTVCIDRRDGRAEFGVGGGITHYSDGQKEFQECAVKSRVLVARRPDFSLLETLLFEPERGYFLLDRHLERLSISARYFDFTCDLEAVKTHLLRAVSGATKERIVRLLVDRKGSAKIEVRERSSRRCVSNFRACLAAEPVDENDFFLFHKTTHRQVYDNRLNACCGVDEVLLWNSKGQVSEFCTGNVVVDLGGERWTPPLACGLLPGTFRAHLLEAGAMREKTISKEDLHEAAKVYLINSVRRWVEVDFVF